MQQYLGKVAPVISRVVKFAADDPVGADAAGSYNASLSVPGER